MRNALAVVSVCGLLGASGFVAWSVLSRSSDGILSPETARSFDLKTVPPPPRAPASAPSEDLRDAVASPRPILYDGLAAAQAVPAAVVKPPESNYVSPKLETQARRSRLFAAVLSAPAKLLASRSVLGSPRALKAFLDDPRAVDAYLNSTVVRAVLASPAVASAVLGRPALVQAFLSSPAMRDPGAVRALLSSRMVAKMLDCPGVQGALADPAVIRSFVGDPQALKWIDENPQAASALAAAAPALAKSLGAAR